MKIIVVYNHKGGVSKTTTTINSCTFLEAYYDRKVCILDCDDYQWSTYEEHKNEMETIQASFDNDIEKIKEAIADKRIVNYDVEECLVAEFIQKLESLKSKGYDYLFVDLGNRTLKQSKHVFELADQVIIPYSNDPQEIKKAISFYELMKDICPEVKANCLVMKITKSEIENHLKIRQTLENQYSLSYYKNIVLSRKRYVNNRSFFYPLNFKLENKDYNKGMIGFVEELLLKSEGVEPVSNLILQN